MAPRNTRTGATATTKRTPAKGATRASSSSRSRSSSPVKRSTPTRAKTSTSRATSGRTGASAPKPRGGKGAKTKRTADPGRWWVLPATVVVMLMVFAWTYYPVARVQYRETREKARLAAELTSLQARNARLREEVDKLTTPEGVEDYARSQLGLVKRGEKVAVVVDGDEAAEASAALATPRIDSAQVAQAPIGPWTAFLDLVFGAQ